MSSQYPSSLLSILEKAAEKFSDLPISGNLTKWSKFLVKLLGCAGNLSASEKWFC